LGGGACPQHSTGLVLETARAAQRGASAAGAAVEVEVAALRGCHADKLTDDGRQRLVRHGHLPEREIMTGIGPVAVRYPRATGLAKAVSALHYRGLHDITMG